MRRLPRPAVLFWGVVAVVSGVVWSTLPLLETLGYEYALFSALLTALAAGHLGALYPHTKAPPRLPKRSLFGHFGRAFKTVLPLPAILLAVSLLNGLWVPFCNLWEGLGFFVLMPLFGAAFAAAMGLVLGTAASSKLKATLLWLLFFVVALLVGVYKFYATPAVYLFHPFIGYYPGVLYDRLIAIDGRLFSYRAVTVVQILTLLAAGNTFFDGKQCRFVPSRFVLRSRPTYVAAALLVCDIALGLLGPAMGHRTDRADLAKQLSVHAAASHLDLYFPVETPAPLRAALLSDARFSLHQVSRYLGVRPQKRIAVFFFRDTEQKGRLIGAAETNVAKPWRREVYVVADAPPHAVLRHELAHAVSADFGAGPFRISGGMLPNPALIEGLATAAGGMRGDLTIHQWAAAMASLGMMPPLEKLFGLGFFDVPAGAAYTAAGSFSSYVREKYGPKALRDAYRHGDFEQATKTPLDVLERDWRRYLGGIVLTEADKAVAEQRFDRTPIIRATCVHEVARICRKADDLERLTAFDAARDLFAAAHRKSGEATETYRDLFFAAVAQGDVKATRKMADHVRFAKGFTRADRDTAVEILADLDRRAGVKKDYGEIYRALAHTAGRAVTARRLLTKAYLAAFEGDLPDGLMAVFAPRPDNTAASLIRSALLIAEAAADHPADPLFQYLLARQCFNGEAFGNALSVLRGIDDVDALPPSIAVAARMLEGRALMHLERYDDAAAVFDAIAAGNVRDGERLIAKDWADRARFLKNPR